MGVIIHLLSTGRTSQHKWPYMANCSHFTLLTYITVAHLAGLLSPAAPAEFSWIIGINMMPPERSKTRQRKNNRIRIGYRGRDFFRIFHQNCVNGFHIQKENHLPNLHFWGSRDIFFVYHFWTKSRRFHFPCINKNMNQISHYGSMGIVYLPTNLL